MVKSSVSAPKRRKASGPKENVKTFDRISSLPDSVLCHILSFLPTKEAVATSILSRRWRTLWTEVQSLDFDDESYSLEGLNPELGVEKVTSFTDFVCRVFIRRRARCIRKFSLSCSCDTFNVDTWVSAAIERELEQLDLSLFLKENFELPPSLFSCKTLVVLKLSGDIDLNIPSSVHLPSFKTLHLRDVVYTNDEFRVLLDGCPVLEDLLVVGNIGIATRFEISVPTMKKLRIDFNSSVEVEKLEINAPHLECLTLRDVVCQRFVHGKLLGLVEANIDLKLKGKNRNSLYELLHQICNVKHLKLSGRTTEALNRSSICDTPLFCNLVQLELIFGRCDWIWLLSLIGNCKMLQVLVIEKIECGHESIWVEPTDVTCLATSLTMFSFGGYQGSEIDLELAKFVLENARVLKTMTISSDSCLTREEKFCALKKLSLLPRASTTCQLAFD